MIVTLPSFEMMLGNQLFRIAGVDNWDDLQYLGRVNLERFKQLAQENILQLISEGHDKYDLLTIRHGIDHIADLIPSAPKRPLLPRLRAESFQINEPVMIYIGDSQNHLPNTDWIKARVTNIEKYYRHEWHDSSANSGYYWRVTATAQQQIFSNQYSISFSTSEPRVMPLWEFNYLYTLSDGDEQLNGDERFLKIYAKNANRSWQPLWCVELGIHCAKTMDMENWLLIGTVEQ